MSKEICFTNAVIVTPNEVLSGHVFVRDGQICDIGTGACPTPYKKDTPVQIEDCEGDILVPGLIELHTDNLEKHLEPRPGVLWPSGRSAFVTHDAQIAAAGITTVFDSWSVGQFHETSSRRTMLNLAHEALQQSRHIGGLRAEHYLHLRCELADPELLELFTPLADEPELRLVSLMDHTPGQRQYCYEPVYRAAYQDKFRWSDEEFAEKVRELKERQEKYAKKHEKTVISYCQERDIPLASHDDTTPEQVDEAVESGVIISEFPTTMEAARHAQNHGLMTIMGAPNVIRGGSHSGNVSALDVAKARILGALSSDYVPSSLLPAAFMLHEKAIFTLPEAIALVSRNPARSVGLTDRGEITSGKRADLVQVHMRTNMPSSQNTSATFPEVRTVWREGMRVI